MSERDCQHCIADRYCDEIPEMSCYNKRIVAELIESEKKKVRQDDIRWKNKKNDNRRCI